MIKKVVFQADNEKQPKHEGGGSWLFFLLSSLFLVS
jgi:hypothetical protein